MPAKKRALAAAGLGAIALACNVPFLLHNSRISAPDSLAVAAVAVASILAVGLLAVPVLTGRGARHQQALAFLATLLLFGLTLVGLPIVGYLPDTHPPFEKWTEFGWVVGFVSASLALATVVGTGRAPRKSVTT